MAKRKRSRVISPNTKNLLWGRAAGRCEFLGCNRLLSEQSVTKEEGNYAENAHIEAVSQGGARYRELMSEDRLNGIDNIMLLCQEHHKYIDEHEEEYSVDILCEMKKKHESRIQKVTEEDGIQESLMVNYFAGIKDVTPVYKDDLFRRAVVRNNYIPKERYSISLGTDCNVFNDGTEEYYKLQAIQLESSLKTKLQPAIPKIENVSVFALAPQPLLMKLGYLLNDISNTTVYQCHRTNEKWSWSESSDEVLYQVNSCNDDINSEYVVLNISLSAEICNERIYDTIQEIVPTYKITINEPNRDFVKRQEIADSFIKSFRSCLENIKNEHPEAKYIKVFPAMPNSLAVRMGMDIMPKTDLSMEIYDQVDSKKGFVKTIVIGEDD